MAEDCWEQSNLLLWEMLVTADDIIVNEMHHAHNTRHYSIEACDSSLAFDTHILGVLEHHQQSTHQPPNVRPTRLWKQIAAAHRKSKRLHLHMYGKSGSEAQPQNGCDFV